MEVVSDVAYKLRYIFDIAVYHILTGPGRTYLFQSLVQWHCGCVFWGFQNTMIRHQQCYLYITCLWCVVCIRVYFRLNHRLCVLHHYVFVIYLCGYCFFTTHINSSLTLSCLLKVVERAFKVLLVTTGCFLF